MLDGRPEELALFAELYRTAKLHWAPPRRPLLDQAKAWLRGGVFTNSTGLDGRFASVGIVDTGLDARHPDLRNADGTTRVAWALDLRSLGPVLDAFVEGGAEKAQQVIDRGQTVDALYAQLFPQVVGVKMADPHGVYRATRPQSIGKYRERIADHSTNLAEVAVVMVKGENATRVRADHAGLTIGRRARDN